MTIIIDLIGSTIVRVSMVIIMLGLMVVLSDSLYNSTINENATEQIVTVQNVMYRDLMRIIPDSGIVSHTNNRMTFYAYTDSTMSFVKRVTYDASQIDNSTGYHRLYRETNSGNYQMANNLVGNSIFTYYDAQGNETISKIHLIQVKLCMPLISSTDTTYINNVIKIQPFNL